MSNEYTAQVKEVIEIKGTRLRKAFAFLLWAIVTVLGIGLLFLPGGALVGLILLGFSVLRVLVAPFWNAGGDTSIILASDGITLPTISGRTTVPWTDIESIGLANVGRSQFPGIRLRTYDGFLQHLEQKPAWRISLGSWGFRTLCRLLGFWYRFRFTRSPYGSSARAGQRDPAMSICSSLRAFGNNERERQQTRHFRHFFRTL